MSNKINAVNFGCLISRISLISGNEMYSGTVQDIHDLVLDCIVVPPAPLPGTVPQEQVDLLLKAMRNGFKIEAIKAYRSLTGVGLKESKDAVELYWPPVSY